MRTAKRRALIVGLLILLVCIGIGYAFLNATLDINGTAKINHNSWDVHFENIVINENSVPIGTGDSAATITTGNTTEVTYSVTLDKPGDFYEFTVDAKNAGTIDAMIEAVTSTVNNQPISSLPNYLIYSATYSDGTEILENHLLRAGSKETYKIRLEFNRDISPSDLLNVPESQTIGFEVGFLQADEIAQEVIHSEGDPVYTTNISRYPDHNVVTIGSAIPNNITQYASAQEATNAFVQHYSLTPTYFTFSLRHMVKDNIVNASYYDFEITQAMVNQNPIMKVGTYSLKGFNGDCSYNNDYTEYHCNNVNPYYVENKATLIEAYGSNNCVENIETFYTSYQCFGYTGAIVYSTGSVGGGNGAYGCEINDNGESCCSDGYEW